MRRTRAPGEGRELATLSTRELMDYLDCARKFGGFYSPWEGSTGYTIEEIRAELATREHVPNKQEAKALRQKQAKAQKSIERRGR